MFSFVRQVFRAPLVTRCRLLSPMSTVAKSANASASRFLVQRLEQKDKCGMLHVTWNNNSVNRYPFAYLRDNCQCSECFHESAFQRSFDTVGKLDPNILPEKYNVRSEGKEMVIAWPDGHVSVFDSEWLHSRRLCDAKDDPSSEMPPTLTREGVEVWNAEILQGNVPKLDFQELIEDDGALLDWLKILHSVGIALVVNTPLEVGHPEKLCDRVGHFKTTHYGHYFDVKAKYQANNLAYTSDTLPLHSDLPYYDYVPGVQMLHCIEQAAGTGGANQFVDGFFVSQELQKKDRKKFDILTKTRMQFVDIGKDMFGDYHHKFARHLIELDKNGQIVRFAYNNSVRDSVVLNSTPEETVQLYEAYLTLGKMLRDPANQIENKMVPGDMIVFNNSRVLHGRSAFTVKEGQSRYLRGIYLDWDAMYSRMRVLAKKLNVPLLY